MKRTHAVVLILLFVALLAGYAAAVEARIIPSPVQALASGTKGNSPDGCPVTLPGENAFTPPAPYPATYPYEGRSWVGSESLWTAIPDDGQWAQLLHGDKAFWWRAGYDVSREPQPALWMTARRLDGAGSVQQEPPATNASHQDFGSAMLTGFRVPEPGCWEITGHYESAAGGEHTLSFVVLVAP